MERNFPPFLPFVSKINAVPLVVKKVVKVSRRRVLKKRYEKEVSKKPS